MNWKTANKIPWNIVLLFGGGFALAKGFVESGLSVWFGEQLVGLAHVKPIVLTLANVTLMSLLTELTSNVATTEMILPILAGLSVYHKNESFAFDDSCNDGCIAGFYAAGGHSAKCHYFWYQPHLG